MTPADDFHVVAFLILRREGRILLARRTGVSYADGHWCLPGGHVEQHEPLAAAAVREAREEVGVEVSSDAVAPIGMCRYSDGSMAGLDVFFLADSFAGEARPVSECDQVAWCSLDDLPHPVVPWLPGALRRHLVDGVWFSEQLA